MPVAGFEDYVHAHNQEHGSGAGCRVPGLRMKDLGIATDNEIVLKVFSTDNPQAEHNN